ncbi:RlpA-like double-psi beta-barrel-protein domain-containing protein-containing protein [Hypoxylon rubiginosum]|uniref:RlpA-like double-psi beta-barrel-protein domain-containing protein-containing protein n=1 Tax=Hypoxylon rubiginosum TaxID=110542 RepID=A0ACC0CXB4_9PEZI|nr:RlpA-like double-psi beta-barrel-protein domain-containing protein-containing protein [Hypoxylon rubiginosum]
MFSLTQIVVALSFSLGYTLAFDGDITYYTPGLGSCGETNTETDKVVAMSPSQFSTIPDLCGKTITIEMGDKNTTAKVVDKCPACDANSIDVSPAVFTDLTPLDTGRAKISWSVDG